jgi:hypothetical protein
MTLDEGTSSSELGELLEVIATDLVDESRCLHAGETVAYNDPRGAYLIATASVVEDGRVER